MKKPILHTLFWLTLFSIAMGFLETSVVVYLRKLYYPNGFGFPLAPIPADVALTEFWREVATIIMLSGAGILAGKNAAQRFGFFIYAFGIWDIFYYVFLKVILGWPAGLFDWDILFLIPVPWVGPVLAPCIVSLSMILLCLCIVWFQEKGLDAKIPKVEKRLLLTGCLVIIASFLWDYCTYIMNMKSAGAMWMPGSKEKLFEEISQYRPGKYNWLVFWAGESMILGAISMYVRNKLKNGMDKPFSQGQ